MPENIPAQDAQAITLREHLEGRIAALAAHLSDAVRHVEEAGIARQDAMRREIELIQQAAAAAVQKAEEAQQLRNEAMNEWKDTVSNLISQYVEQRQLTAAVSAINEKIESLEKNLESSINGAERTLMQADRAIQEKAETWFSANAKRLTALENWKNNMQGRLWGVPILIGVIVFIITQLMRVLFPAAGK